MRNLLCSDIIKHEFLNQGNQQTSKSKFIYLAKGNSYQSYNLNLQLK